MKCNSCSCEYPKAKIIDGVGYFVCSECGEIYEVKNYRLQSKEQLIEKIESAFLGVVLGDGVGLYEAQALDNYESDEVQKKQREKDEKLDWRVIPTIELQYCHSSLSFFDSKGMAFHLPAYIVGSINGEIDDPIFHLTHLSEHVELKLDSLNIIQKKVVKEYLTWCLTEDEYQFEHASIQNALDKYWC